MFEQAPRYIAACVKSLKIAHSIEESFLSGVPTGRLSSGDPRTCPYFVLSSLFWGNIQGNILLYATIAILKHVSLTSTIETFQQSILFFYRYLVMSPWIERLSTDMWHYLALSDIGYMYSKQKSYICTTTYYKWESFICIVFYLQHRFQPNLSNIRVKVHAFCGGEKVIFTKNGLHLITHNFLHIS